MREYQSWLRFENVTILNIVGELTSRKSIYFFRDGIVVQVELGWDSVITDGKKVNPTLIGLE